MHRYGGLPAPAGRARGARALRLPLALPRRGDGGGRALARGASPARAAAAVRRALAARRAGARRDLHRLSLGRERLCARRLAARPASRRGSASTASARSSAGARGGASASAGCGARAPGSGLRRRCWRSLGARRALPAASTSPGRPARSRSRCCRATSPQDEKFAAALHAAGAGLDRGAAAGGARRARDRPGDRHPAAARAARPGLLAGAARALPRGPGGPRCSACRSATTQRGYTNSAVGISAATAALPDGFYRYDKHHLVPFGEFIPTGFRWFTEMMNIPLGDFNRGPAARRRRSTVGGERVAPNICYEDLFGEELAARFVAEDAGADDPRQPQQHRLVRRAPSRSTSTCRSRACARSSCSGRWSAPPTPARPP